MSWNALVERLNSAAHRAFACATATLACCVSSIFSKYTRNPAGSTIATAMFQLFARASANAAAAAFFDSSDPIARPYVIGPSLNHKERKAHKE